MKNYLSSWRFVPRHRYHEFATQLALIARHRGTWLTHLGTDISLTQGMLRWKVFVFFCAKDMDSFSGKIAKFLKHHENISIYLNRCSCSSGITSTPQTCCVELRHVNQHTPKPWINAALKLSLVGYVSVDMFYTPPLFKVNNVFSQKISKNKKSPGFFWLSQSWVRVSQRRLLRQRWWTEDCYMTPAGHGLISS